MKISAFVLSTFLASASAGCLDTTYDAHVRKVAEGWSEPEVLFTIGQTCNRYTPPGIPDGMGAIRLNQKTVRVFVNHELRSAQGSEFLIPTLTNVCGGLTGARVSFFDVDAETRELLDAGLAYKSIFNRGGEIVRKASDLEFVGKNRFCSAQLFEAGTYGLEDDIFFTGEETGGGTEFALDTKAGKLYAAPWMGRAAWESVTMFDQPDEDHVAILGGDDRGGAPLLLYIGEKLTGAGFLERNGLAKGDLYVWKSDDGTSGRGQLDEPYRFSAQGGQVTSQTGKFIKINHYQPDMADEDGFDALGFADQDTQDDLSIDAGAFLFSRPEDLSTNPNDGSQAVFHSTGRSSLYDGTELWGQTFLVDVDFSSFVPGQPIPADISVLYDGNVSGDDGIRSPDNGVWAKDGIVYVQEDRSYSEFCKISGEETSIWALNPTDSSTERIYQVNRNAALPPGQTDIDPDDCGDWETSGIIDVTDLFDNHGCNPLLLANAQSHSVRFDDIQTNSDLVQGGQIFFLCKQE